MGVLGKFLRIGVVLVFMGAFLPTHVAVANTGHPVKSLFVDRWYQLQTDSGSYSTWMTLSTHRHYEQSSQATAWATPISNAISSWNSQDTTVYFSEGTPNESDDVHIIVTEYEYTHFSTIFTIPSGALGITYLLDEAYDRCTGGNCDANHSRPNTWWYALVMVDDDEHSGFYGTSYQREATVAHELGHVIGLAHDGLGDGVCATSTIPPTVMDYDCLDTETTKSPLDWDVCGVNHDYYDPNWGYAGCSDTWPY